jgi:hypothetical protein
MQKSAIMVQTSSTVVLKKILIKVFILLGYLTDLSKERQFRYRKIFIKIFPSTFCLPPLILILTFKTYFRSPLLSHKKIVLHIA